MLKEERHQYILNRINQNYRIYITFWTSEVMRLATFSQFK